MLKLLIKAIAGLIILFPLIINIQKKPDFWFWLSLNLFFDPGGYVSGFLGGNIFGRLNISDVVIVLIVACLMSPKVNLKAIYNDAFLKKFLRYFALFAIYYFVFYGWIVPYMHNDLDYTTFLLKNRRYIYGVIILISVYIFSLRDLKYFYFITLFFGVVSLSLYWVSLLSGINLIPYLEIERYRGFGMMRIAMLSYGYFGLLFPLALSVYLISYKVKFSIRYKKWLYYGGFLMLMTLLITLTRRTILNIIGTAGIIVLLISYLFRTAKFAASLKIIIAALLVLLALNFTLPKYIDYISKISKDTFSLITMGEDTRGVGNYRVSGTGDLLITKRYIKNNLWFGTGYTRLYWGEKGFASSPRGATYALAADAAREVSIYYLFFGYGIVGAILMFPLYFIMAKLFFRLSRLLKQNLTTYLQDPFIILFSIYVLLIIASRFTYKFYGLGSDFGGSRFVNTAVFLGIGFALLKILKTGRNVIAIDNKKNK